MTPIAQEGLTGEDADLAFEQWEQAGYAAVMATRKYAVRKAERDYNKAYKQRTKAKKAQASQ